MFDRFKPRGPIKSSKPDAGNANIRSVPVFGVVKDNVDPVRMGRIQVYLLDLGGEDQNDADSWITVGQLPNFYGYTAPRGGNKPEDYGTYDRNPHSYGAWQSPPDIGTVVICMFVNGDPNFGYYIGCVPNPDALQMIPAIGASTNIVLSDSEASSYGGATRLPVTNLNPNNPKSNDADYVNMPKPVHSYVAAIMNQQGIIRDPIRGPISSSAQRESPSRVGWGVSTPGRPIYEGNYTDESVVQAALADKPDVKVVGRRGGHSIVMDDGDWVGNDQLIRIRTALGHQILMSDNGQTLMILHSNGQSYIELGKEGTIDMYATNSVNIRTQGDLNLHADNDVNINAAKKLNIQADSITINSEKDYSLRVGGDSILQTIGKFTHKIGGAMSMAASGVASFASSAVTYINGSTINLNTGQTGVIPKDVPLPTNVAHTDTLYDKEKGFLAAPGKLISIVSRAPAHAPWASAGQGVNVPTTLNADAQLPSEPSSGTSEINAMASENPSVPVSAAAAATVPTTAPVSPAIGTGETKALIGAISTNVASSAAATAAAAGGGLVRTAQGTIPVIGSLGLTPQQLQNDGTTKPGSAALSMALAQDAGATLAKALPNAVFTGKAGAENLQAVASSVSTQAQIAVSGLQQANAALTQAGVISGTESGASAAGLVLSASTAGVASTINAVKNLANNVTGALGAGAQGLVNAGKNLISGAQGAISSITATINSGNFAAKLGSTSGAFGAISGALGKIGGGITDVLNQAKGIAAGAFNAIKGALPKLKANVPQNLTAINEASKAASSAETTGNAELAKIAELQSGTLDAITALKQNLGESASSIAGGGLGGNIGSALSGVAGGVLGSGNSLLSSAAGALTTLKTAGNAAINSAGSLVANAANTLARTTSATNITSGVDSAVASGVSNIPGGQNAIASITDYSNSVVDSIPGTGTIKALVDSSSTAVNNGISLSNSIGSAANSLTGALGGTARSLGSAAGVLTGVLGSAAGALTGALGSAAGALSGALGGAAGALSGALGGAAGALTGALSSGLEKLKSSGLASLIQSGLPADAAAKLNSSISGLSSGVIKVTTPQVGLNTTDRAQIDSQTTSLIGNAPPPNFSGTVSDATTSSLNAAEEKNNKLSDILKQIDDLIIERDKVEIKFNAANAEWANLLNTKPQGDPSINLAKLSAKSAFAEVNTLNNKILSLREQQYALQGTTGNRERDRIRGL
jgi:hypothetical protein